MSKVASCLGVSKALDEGFFSLQSRVMDYFDEEKITNPGNVEVLKKLKVKQLLSMTTGHSKPLMMKKDYKSLPEETDYISHILNEDMKHEPGSFFMYNNSATYLLAAMV